MHNNSHIPMARAFAFVSTVVLEANLGQTVVMENSVYDLTILQSLEVTPCHSKAPRIIPVFWALPLRGLLKINTDSAAMGQEFTGHGGFVQNS